MRQSILNNIILPILVIFLGNCAGAQSHVLLRDEFLEARPHWQVRQGEVAYEEGRMILTETDLTRRNVHAIEQFLNRSEDYAISLDLIPLKAMGAASFGILFGGDESLNNYYSFEINTEGFARVVEIREGQERILKNWTKNRKIKGVEEEHLITLQKKGKGAYFFVNEKELFRIDFPPVYGFFQGISTYGAFEISIASFEILHPLVIFPELGGAWPGAIRLHLDTTINTPYKDETHPRFHPQKVQFYFTRDKNIHETHMSDSGWVAGMPVEGPFNNGRHNRISTFFGNGKKLLLGNDYGRDKQSLAYTDWEEEKWGEIQKFPMPSIQPLNDKPIDWFVSDDGKTLLFSAELPGGYGKADIYICFREDDRWTSPLNLGPSVNTFAEEYSPYLKDDQETLIFGTNGRAGYGKGDLYQSRRRSHNWQNWSFPENLGPGVNTSRWDRDFYPHPRELRTYFVASQDSLEGDYDLFRIKVPIDLEAQPLMKVFGDVYLEGTDQRMESEVQAWRVGAGIQKEADAFAKAGSYGMLLPLGEAYQLYALKLGYYPIIDTLDARAFTTYREIRQDLYLKKLEPGVRVTLQQLFFVRGKAELLPESYPELTRLHQLMQTRPRMKIEIHGHTDNIGTPGQLKRLSEQRAARVRQYLINNRISPDRMTSKGFGPDRPIAPNENPITRALNRRVEFLIISD